MIKKQIIIFIAVALSLFFYCGCQPTPKNEIVVGKSSADFKEQPEGSQTKKTEFKAPKELKTQFASSNNTLAVSFDAVVDVPQNTGFPVYKLTQNEISTEQANAIVKAFFKDDDVYFSSTSTTPTKQQIEDEIVRLKQGDSDLAKQDRAAYEDMIAPEIAELEKIYQNAPDKVQTVAFDGEFKDQVLPTALDPFPYNLIYGEDVKTIDVMAKGLNGRQARLVIEKDSAGFGAFEYIEDAGDQPIIGKAGDSVAQDLSIAKNLPTISADEAQKQAEQFAQTLNIGDFAVVERGAALAGEYPKVEKEDLQYDDFPKCYVFYLTRKMALPINYAANLMNNVEFARSWDNELLTIYSDDRGILRVKYTSPTKIVETVSQAVELLAFDELVQKLQEQFKRTYELPEENVSRIDFEINKIKLGLGRISRSEDFSDCLLLPVWDVYGTYKTTYVDGEVQETFDLGLSFLTLNAVDGSVVDRSKGV